MLSGGQGLMRRLAEWDCSTKLTGSPNTPGKHNIVLPLSETTVKLILEVVEHVSGGTHMQ
jgi:hypothetical protein